MHEFFKDNIPEAMQEDKRWILWELTPDKAGNMTKTPYRAADHKNRGGVHEQQHWADFQTAVNAAKFYNCGIGYDLGGYNNINSPTCGVIVLDLDHVLDPTTKEIIFPAAKEFFDVAKDLGAYIEISQSGEGLHIFGIGSKIGDKCKAYFTEAKGKGTPGIECYDSSRFIAMTGNLYPGIEKNEDLVDIQTLVDKTEEFVRQYHNTNTDPATTPGKKRLPPVDLTDPDILEKAAQSKNGAKFTALYYNGDVSGYPSQSEADLALCELLAFWTNGDPGRIENLFSGSALARGKWNQREDYRQRTINMALIHWTHSGCPHYDPQEYAAQQIIKAFSDKEIEPEKLAGLLDYEQTDYGNALRLAALFGKDIRWNTDRKKWLAYNGKRGIWEYINPEALYSLHHRAIQAAINLLRTIPMDTKEFTAYNNFLKKSNNNRGTRDTIEQLKGVEGMIIKEADLDRHTFYINTPAGVLDLENNKEIPQARELYLTKCTRGGFTDPTEENRKKWNDFVCDILPDKEVRDYMQRLCGAGLTGSYNDQEFYFIYGSGGNGKGTFLETVSYMLGDYAGAASIETFLASRNDGGEKATPELVAMKDKRMIFAQESDRGRALRVSRLKSITGGDIITGRRLFEEGQQFRITARITIQTNYLPDIYDVYDEGLKRRFTIIPFEKEFINKANKNLQQELQTPGMADAVFEWAREGLAAWFKNGKCIVKNSEELPNAIKKAISNYYQDQDTTGKFVDECCNIGPGLSVRRSELYQRYINFYPELKFKGGAKKKFFTDIEKAGYQKAIISGERVYKGLELKKEFEIPY